MSYITMFSDKESFNHRSRECTHIIESRKYVFFSLITTILNPS